MDYRWLSPNLHSTADAVAQYFKLNWGVRKFEVESPIDTTIEYSPTLHAVDEEFYHVCIDVSESPYPRGLESFVLKCVTECIPVKSFVALPEGSSSPDFRKDLRSARQLGIGILEVSPGGVKVLHPSQPLSLAAVRPVQADRFPRKYRYHLSQAETTFKQGNPSKGCSMVYDEMEAVFRKVAKRTRDTALWRPLRQGERAPRISRTVPWAKVVEAVMDHLDPAKCNCLGRPLMARILGVTPHRNDTAHKPANREELVRRDRELRTRFENAVDLLFDLVDAVRPLHV